MIIKVHLIFELLSAVCLAEIFCLDESGAWIYLANRGHAGADRDALVDHGANERPVVPGMRVPMPVESGESGCREWLIYRREHLEPRIALGDRSGEQRELFSERRMEKIGPLRSAAVMHEPGDGLDANLSQSA